MRRGNCTGQRPSLGKNVILIVLDNMAETTFISVTLETRRRGAMCPADLTGLPSITTQGDCPLVDILCQLL